MKVKIRGLEYGTFFTYEGKMYRTTPIMTNFNPTTQQTYIVNCHRCHKGNNGYTWIDPDTEVEVEVTSNVKI